MAILFLILIALNERGLGNLVAYPAAPWLYLGLKFALLPILALTLISRPVRARLSGADVPNTLWLSLQALPAIAYIALLIVHPRPWAQDPEPTKRAVTGFTTLGVGLLLSLGLGIAFMTDTRRTPGGSGRSLWSDRDVGKGTGADLQ